MAVVKSVNAQQKNEIATQPFYESSLKTRANTNFRVSTMWVRKEKRDTDTPKFRMFEPFRNTVTVASNLSLFVDMIYDDVIAGIIQTDLIYTDYGFQNCVDVISESDEDFKGYVLNVLSYVLEHGPFISAWGQYPFIIEKIDGYYPTINGKVCEYLKDSVDKYVADVRAEFMSNLKDYIKHSNRRGELISPTSKVVLDEMRAEAERDMYYTCRP